MKVYAILNNYQMSSYAHNVLKSHIVEETRLDPKHTKVVWDDMSISDVRLLGKALGGEGRVKEVGND